MSNTQNQCYVAQWVLAEENSPENYNDPQLNPAAEPFQPKKPKKLNQEAKTFDPSSSQHKQQQNHYSPLIVSSNPLRKP